MIAKALLFSILFSFAVPEREFLTIDISRFDRKDRGAENGEREYILIKDDGTMLVNTQEHGKKNAQSRIIHLTPADYQTIRKKFIELKLDEPLTRQAKTNYEKNLSISASIASLEGSKIISVSGNAEIMQVDPIYIRGEEFMKFIKTYDKP